ncbi:MAG TPA: RNA polymerase sigma factor [Gemmataceae bacterium]|jgi:RNA polymerase sigma factor (sigma-70 family)|nr:RNA polymerase sigma factor [Gemmataceae bacterium]
MKNVIQHLRRVVLAPDGVGQTDGQLLGSFVEHRDEAAFEALVRRHGPMVLGVCRRLLHNQHDVEDAFQATFLVLVRKPASVVPRDMVANWLYGVAHQTAIRTRAADAKRRRRERQVVVMPEPEAVSQARPDDLLLLLDQELSRLPDKYRVAIVLCDLEGKTRKEAARQLGWPEGSVSSRLARARVMLAKRLTRQGVILSSGSLTVALSANVASASVPTSLVSATIKAASLYAAGQVIAAGAISAKVVALTEEVVKTMFLTKLKMATMVLLAVSMVAVGGGLVAQHLAIAQQGQVQQPPAERREDAARARGKPKQPDDEVKGGDHKAEAEPKLAGQTAPQAEPPARLTRERVKKLRDLVSRPITVDFPPGSTTKDAFDFLQDVYKVTILVDEQAWKDDPDLKAQFPEGILIQPVKLPKLLGVPLATVLRLLVGPVGGDFQLRSDFIVLVPRKQVTSGQVLRQPVDATFENMSLNEALEQLSALTGVTIVLDSRAGKAAVAAHVTASFNGLPLETAVRMLADMADLAPVRLDNGLYVTTNDNAIVLQAAEDRRKLTMPKPEPAGAGSAKTGAVPKAAAQHSK